MSVRRIFTTVMSMPCAIIRMVTTAASVSRATVDLDTWGTAMVHMFTMA